MSTKCEVAGNKPIGGDSGSTIDVRAYEVLIKADGVTGENCDFISSNDAIVAGKRSMFVKAADPHFGTSENSPAAGGSLLVRDLSGKHPFSVNDKCVVTSSEANGTKFVEGVFNVDSVIDAQDFTIPLKNNAGTYSTKLGGFTSGKNLSFHKADPNTIVFLNNVDYTGLNIVGESKFLSTISGANCIDMLVAGIKGTQINIDNIGFRPSAIGGLGIHIDNNSILFDTKIKNCLFNGFFNAEYNGNLWGGAFKIDLNSFANLNIFEFDNCSFSGVFDLTTRICIDFDNFGFQLGRKLSVVNSLFTGINGIHINVAEDVLGYKIFNNVFDAYYHNCVKVHAPAFFNSDGEIIKNFFTNGIDTAFIPADPKHDAVLIGTLAFNILIQENFFATNGGLTIRPFYALVLDAGASKLNIQICDNKFATIRVTGIRLLSGNACNVSTNNFTNNGTSAIAYAAAFIGSTVTDNLMRAGGVIESGAPGANVVRTNNFKRS